MSTTELVKCDSCGTMTGESRCGVCGASISRSLWTPDPAVPGRQSDSTSLPSEQRTAAGSKKAKPIVAVALFAVMILGGYILVHRRSSTPVVQRTDRRSTGSSAAAPVATSQAPISVSSTSAVILSTSGPTGAAATSRPPASHPAERALTPSAIVAMADCVSPDANDASNNPVVYWPANAIDGRAETAWRCPGSPSSGESIGLISTFERPMSLRQVGAIPGYAKSDSRYPTLDRFVQNNRVAQATWTCTSDTGQTATANQTFLDNRPLQLVAVTWDRCVEVRFTVTSVYPARAQDLPDPPGPQDAMDQTAVSELKFVGWESV